MPERKKKAARDSAHAAAKEVPLAAAPTVRPTTPVKPVQQAQPQPQPTVKPAQQPAPVQAEYKPEGVALDYEVNMADAVRTPVPTLNVPGGTASARQLQQGAPVLSMPDAPGAPDFSDAVRREDHA